MNCRRQRSHSSMNRVDPHMHTISGFPSSSNTYKPLRRASRLPRRSSGRYHPGIADFYLWPSFYLHQDGRVDYFPCSFFFFAFSSLPILSCCTDSPFSYTLHEPFPYRFRCPESNMTTCPFARRLYSRKRSNDACDSSILARLPSTSQTKR